MYILYSTISLNHISMDIQPAQAEYLYICIIVIYKKYEKYIAPELIIFFEVA